MCTWKRAKLRFQNNVVFWCFLIFECLTFDLMFFNMCVSGGGRGKGGTEEGKRGREEGKLVWERGSTFLGFHKSQLILAAIPSYETMLILISSVGIQDF